MNSIAFIIPWFGASLKGGAEQHTYQVAKRLADRGHDIEILTTCCRSFYDNWSDNHLPAGLSQEGNLKVRRFKVKPRNQQVFDAVNYQLIQTNQWQRGVPPVDETSAADFCAQNINSPDLLAYLQANHDRYAHFVFIPYLYGPILNGLPLVADRAILNPCLHDESYAYLSQVETLFHQAQSLLFISEGEALLAEQIYGPCVPAKSYVVGAGAENELLQPSDWVAPKGCPDRFILCLGKRDQHKNTYMLIDAYQAFRQANPKSDVKLVLAGPGDASFHTDVADVFDFGLVSEAEKAYLLQNCLALFQPSQNESFSRVMVEAWFVKKPVIAHRDCLATATAVKSAHGGWTAGSHTEWVDAFSKIDHLPAEQYQEYGQSGFNYAQTKATWNKVIDAYEVALNLRSAAPPATISKTPKLKAIHQLLPNLAYGDAISNEAITIRDHLRDQGYASEIFVQHIDPKIIHEGSPYVEGKIGPQAGLIYHHSIGSGITQAAITHPGPKCLIYHNITPAKFFEQYRPEFAAILEQGRIDLKDLAQHFPLSVGDSSYNALELKESGFQNPGIFPLIIDPQKWNHPSDRELMRSLQDGRKNLLFVGRLAPNKRQDELLEAFSHYLTMDDQARLILIGYAADTDPYYIHLMNTIERFHLQPYVVMPGHVNEAQLMAYYRTADVFWSMSEHEGFCVPLIEAMWFNLPVLAYGCTAIPETMGQAGIQLTDKTDLVRVAAVAKVLAHDPRLRSSVIAAQQQQRLTFSVESVYQKLDQLTNQLEASVKP
jgi:glycosyltransferase involved in cell wall biosynthesis